MRTFLGLRIHRGTPENPTRLRAYTSSLLMKDYPREEGLNYYTDHTIARWYGLSFKLRWFAGIWLLGETSYPTERGPIPTHPETNAEGDQ